MQISNLVDGRQFGVALKALNIMLYAFIWCGLWGRQSWGAAEVECGVWSANQNSNCNWSLTSIISFNYIYLFARRLLSCPLYTPPSLQSPVVSVVDDDDALELPVPVPVPDSWRPCRLVSLWFAFHLCMGPGHVYYFISFYFISFHLSFFLLSGDARASAQPALLWLSCFIQQLMRKLAVVWIIYNSTHVMEAAAAADGGCEKHYASGV